MAFGNPFSRWGPTPFPKCVPLLRSAWLGRLSSVPFFFGLPSVFFSPLAGDQETRDGNSCSFFMLVFSSFAVDDCLFSPPRWTPNGGALFLPSWIPSVFPAFGFAPSPLVVYLGWYPMICFFPSDIFLYFFWVFYGRFSH